MKRLILPLVAGVFGTLLILPLASAQDYHDPNDASQIHEDQRDIHHDQHQERRDLENGNVGAAVHEQKDINRDRANEDATKEELGHDVHHDADWDRHHHDDGNE